MFYTDEIKRAYEYDKKMNYEEDFVEWFSAYPDDITVQEFNAAWSFQSIDEWYSKNGYMYEDKKGA